MWQRGILEEEFRVPLSSVQFYVGAVEPAKSERISKVPHSLPSGISVSAIPAGKNLSDMLASGEIDAIFSASRPSSFDTSPDVDYLFPNFKEVEAEYYRRTRIFPIMHVVAIKRDVYNKNPWIAESLTKAFARALDIGYEPLHERSALRYMLPWLEDNVSETRRLMDESERWWQDGFMDNRHVIDKFLEYHWRQGLSTRRFRPEEIFASNALETYVL